jgi:hypothetical protein
MDLAWAQVGIVARDHEYKDDHYPNRPGLSEEALWCSGLSGIANTGGKATTNSATTIQLFKRMAPPRCSTCHCCCAAVQTR